MSNPRALSVLSHKDVEISKNLSSVIGFKQIGSINALFELILGSPLPTSNSIIFTPHDHAFLGTAIPRNMLYSFDWGESNVWNWTSLNTGTGWFRSDNDGGALDTNSNNVIYGANIKIFPTPQNKTTETPVGGGSSYLEAKIFTKVTQSVSFRIRNRTTNTYSSTVSCSSTTGTWLSFDVPFIGGEWNDIDIETFVSIAPSSCVYIYSILIVETRSKTQKESAGSYSMSSATKP